MTVPSAAAPSARLSAAGRRDAGALFFIVGRGRSGTTLLARLLSSHPEIFVAPEGLFVVSLHGRYRRGAWNAERATRFARDLWSEERLRRWRLDAGELEERLVATAAAGGTLPDLAAAVYRASAEGHGRPGVRLLGDKNPHYALFVETLAELFPAARFIHLVRDYRDNLLSYRSVRFDLGSVPALAYRWRRYNQAVLRAARGREERFLRLRFEDLVGAPEDNLRRLCTFLGVSWAPEMLDFHHQPGDELPWHGNLRRPLDPAQLGKWRQRLTPAEIALADRVAQPLGAELGYPRAEVPGAEAGSSAEAGPSSAEPSTGGGPAPWLSAVPGAAWGAAVTGLEEVLFRLPLAVRTAVIRTYRAATGNRIR